MRPANLVRPEQLRARRDKYHRSPPSARRWNGRTYASKAEMRYAQQLHAMPSVRLVIEQPRIWLGVPENVCVPDFFVLDGDDAYFIDVKGAETAAWKRQKRLWRAYGSLALRVVDARTLRVREVIEPARRCR